jgi:AraC-like DNA-binding protein
VTLLPSEAQSGLDCGHATQALLVRTYLERGRRPPLSRRELHTVRILPPHGPASLPPPADPYVEGERLEPWATPDLPTTVTRPAVDRPLLRRSLEGPAASRRIPATLRSAIAVIETRAAEPIGLAEIADAAQISPRALQAAFRKHLGTTPLGHLHAIRMARVHTDLLAAQPGDGQTVSAVANRWGFSQLSRFARDYKQRYGVSPRETLSRSAR